MRAFTQITTACLLVLSLGAHWALLQTVAWTGMMISYSQGATLQQAIAKTFDGKHPCPLCKTIQQGRAEEQKSERQPLDSSPKLDLAVVWQAPDFIFGAKGERIESSQMFPVVRSEEPPKPRPRSA